MITLGSRPHSPSTPDDEVGARAAQREGGRELHLCSCANSGGTTALDAYPLTTCRHRDSRGGPAVPREGVSWLVDLKQAEQPRDRRLCTYRLNVPSESTAQAAPSRHYQARDARRGHELMGRPSSEMRCALTVYLGVDVQAAQALHRGWERACTEPLVSMFGPSATCKGRRGHLRPDMNNRQQCQTSAPTLAMTARWYYCGCYLRSAGSGHDSPLTKQFQNRQKQVTPSGPDPTMASS